MDEPRAQRTLVKSPPELWAEVSDVDALAAHLGEFGDIRITRAEPETTVAWEGDRGRGTVELEPTAWGTKVTLTARVEDGQETAAVVAEPQEQGPDAEPERVAEPEPEPVAAVEPEPDADADADAPSEPEAPAPRRGFLARLFGRRAAASAEAAPLAATVAPAAVAPAPEPEPVAQREPAGLAEAVSGEPAAEREPEAPPVPRPLTTDRAEAILSAVLDDLGSAHHRPFSR
jgi:hypothetical protein